jgi:peptidoglycan/xylan/chitin deacetylase (PgdA/CDA1 family)
MPTRAKLPRLTLVETLLLNPRVGAADPEIIRRFDAGGHEIGLHGGRNHATWASAAPTWPAARVTEELEWGLATLARAGVRPQGFASPAWRGGELIDTVLAELGFRYVADEHGPGQAITLREPLPSIRTAISAEPGGVGYVESARAAGLSDREFAAGFRERLLSSGPVAIAYDHPFWAGTSDLERVALMVNIARDEGFRISTIADALAAG